MGLLTVETARKTNLINVKFLTVMTKTPNYLFTRLGLLQNRYRRRACGYPDSCRQTSADLATSGVSRVEGGAATLREEANRWLGEGPPLGVRPEAVPEAAARAAGAGGKARL